MYPYCRFLIYGESGVGKTTMVSTFPGPIVMASFDASLKESPILRLGTPGPVQGVEQGLPWQDVVKVDGSVAARIVFFHESDPERPSAYRMFCEWLRTFDAAARKGVETFVVDSMSALHRACFYEQRYRMNPDYKDPRKWHADSADRLEELVCNRLSGIMDCNVVLTAHISERFDELHGTHVHRIKAPGRLGMSIPDQFPEVYRLYVTADGQRWVQTQKDSHWQAGSGFIQAPNPCLPEYPRLWAGEQWAEVVEAAAEAVLGGSSANTDAALQEKADGASEKVDEQTAAQAAE